MSTHADLLRVLYDPVQYYRPWRQASAALQPAQRTALNGWLAQRHALPAYAPPPAEQRACIQRLVAGWARLPDAAYLMACARHRHRLMGSRAFVRLPRPVHAFLRLPFAPCGPSPVDVEDEYSLRAWGAACLLHGLHDHVPSWVLARARLCFTGLVVPPHAGAGPGDAFDMTCFWSAWNHAANLS
ncbi:hypothetical protein [Stenotrophomonas sp. NPDC077659]|uniref:hypothetical protein n=1 Tax=Stenotrophomonas sp. NPDC077659 TaxID=3390694 RepID=UPI003D001124